MSTPSLIKPEDIDAKLIALRNQSILLDTDVASLYEVSTKAINQAVKNNPEKFPEGYVFPLTAAEKAELVKNFDRFSKLKHASAQAKAFTEKGLYMLATILKSKRATQTTLSIIETYARIKQLSRNVAELSAEHSKQKKEELLHKGGEIMAELLGNDLKIKGTETSIELNFAILKFKHTVKKGKDQ